jgi:hypothetical protein
MRFLNVFLKGFNCWLMILCAFGLGIAAGLVPGLWFGQHLASTRTFLVYSESCPNAWHVNSFDDAEKKAHFLVYDLDANLAIITDSDNRLVSQVRKGDGRDVGGAD